MDGRMVYWRQRAPKKSFYALKGRLGQENSTLPHRSLPRAPFVSVIVCSYNGGRTLTPCLDSLGKLNYPDYEIILVDDGSTDDTRDIAEQFLHVRYIYQENHGLSHARNTGAAAAKGEVFAYTDSDCMADVDWLYYLIGTLLSGHYAGVGGPNVTPPAQNWIQACVAAAPGGPSHVLLTDIIAEHIPGCNMAFYRWAFENIGGFVPQGRRRCRFLLATSTGWLRHCFQPDRDRVASSPIHTAGFFETTRWLRRSGIAAAL